MLQSAAGPIRRLTSLPTDGDGCGLPRHFTVKIMTIFIARYYDRPERVHLEQFTRFIRELLCKDLRANPCRETGAGGLCPP
jgi:hypothetical protein